MKYTWTPQDITAGRVVCKNWTPKNALDSFPAKDGWRQKHFYKIGWLAGGNPQREYHPIPKGLTNPERRKHLEENRADWCLIAMTDGMIGNPKTQKELCDLLNDYELIPCKKEWFVAMISEMNSFYGQ